MSDTCYIVLIAAGSSKYGPKGGWDRLFGVRSDAEACAAEARKQDGWEAKVVEMTLAEAARYGWIAGLRNDARYHDLCRTYGDHSPEVNRHLANCVAVQARDGNHT